MKTRFATIALLWASLASHPLQAADDFQACLTDLQDRARQAGVADRIVQQVVPQINQQQRVLELDRRQPEFVQTFREYLRARVSDERVERGRELYERYRPFLKALTDTYGVPGQYLIAFWGLETNFGSYLGNMPTLDSLATLACDPRRSDFFSGEFVTALRVLEREALDPEDMRGSWAGAMGHTQFMPSNYLRYAVDGDGDGEVDLWGSERDALASGANFLQHLGWEPGLRWGREVRLPEAFNYHLADGEQRPLQTWARKGVKRADGAPLPEANVDARLLVPAGHRGPAFLVYDNFSVIMKWNRSESYALSVGHLADRIAGAGELRQPPPEQPRLSRERVKAMQVALNRLGYEAGEPDGIFGPSTRDALSSYEKDRGKVSDGFPDSDILDQLLDDET